MTDQNDQKEERAESPVYEASWAPKDPRDDSSCDQGPSLKSRFRVFAAMHPLFNSFVLIYDGLKKLFHKDVSKP